MKKLIIISGDDADTSIKAAILAETLAEKLSKQEYGQKEDKEINEEHHE